MKPSCCCFYLFFRSMKIIFIEANGTNVKTKSEKNHHCCLGINYFPCSAMRTNFWVYSSLYTRYIPTLIMNRLKKSLFRFNLFYFVACMLKCACLTVVKRNENSIFHCAILNWSCRMVKREWIKSQKQKKMMEQKF